MTNVRPPLWPQAAQTPVNRAPAQSAGQRAFFDAALGRAGGAAGQPTQPAAPVTPAQTRPQTTSTPANLAAARFAAAQPPAQPAEGERIPRPGSIIDIRV